MKTILLSDGTLQRVTNEVANTEVSFGRAKYAQKTEWKNTVRNVAKSETVKISEVKGAETKIKKAEKRENLKKAQRYLDSIDHLLR